MSLPYLSLFLKLYFLISEHLCNFFVESLTSCFIKRTEANQSLGEFFMFTWLRNIGSVYFCCSCRNKELNFPLMIWLLLVDFPRGYFLYKVWALHFLTDAILSLVKVLLMWRQSVEGGEAFYSPMIRSQSFSELQPLETFRSASQLPYFPATWNRKSSRTWNWLFPLLYVQN